MLQAKTPLGSVVEQEAAVLQAQLHLGQSCDTKDSAAGLHFGLPPPQAAASANDDADKARAAAGPAHAQSFSFFQPFQSGMQQASPAFMVAPTAASAGAKPTLTKEIKA